MVAIEHNLDVVAAANCVIDMGPESGAAGGRVVAWGRPEAIARHRSSRTASHLRECLASALRKADVEAGEETA